MGGLKNNNPQHILSVEDQRKGSKAGVRARQARKTLREELLALLSKGNTQERLSVALLDKALNGDVSAFNTIRDTIGEKPIDKVETKMEATIEVDLEDE